MVNRGKKLNEGIKTLVADVIKKQPSDPAFLGNSRILDKELQLIEGQSECRKLFEEVHANLSNGKKLRNKKQKYRDFEILIANLLKAKRKNRRVTFSCNVNNYTNKNNKKSQYKKCTKFIIDCKEELERMGMIGVKPGFNDPENPKRSRQTRLWPTKKFIEMFGHLPYQVIHCPSLIVVKDEEGELKEFNDTVKTDRIRKILKKANKINAEAEILLEKNNKVIRLDTNLHCVFYEKFTLGGRLYTGGTHHYQQFSGEDRARFTINGEPVVEYDFSGLHPRILYAKEGLQYDGDPYSEVNDDRVFRPWLKIILLAILNSKDRNTARGAAWEWLNPKDVWKWKLPSRFDVSLKQRNCVKQIMAIKNKGFHDATPFIDAFHKKHQSIAKYFCEGKETGLRLFNQDGKMALDIVWHFAKKNIPILAIHDSFIVQQQHSDELETVMQKQYAKHTKYTKKVDGIKHTTTFECPIK